MRPRSGTTRWRCPSRSPREIAATDRQRPFGDYINPPSHNRACLLWVISSVAVIRLLIVTVFRRRFLTLTSRSGGKHEYDPDCFTRKKRSTEIQGLGSERRGNGAVQSCEPCTSANATAAA